jgi:hypothetical protein
MKQLVKFGVAAVLAAGLVQAGAATTNYWVQNLNAALTVYAQSGTSIAKASVPTKSLINLMSGVTVTDTNIIVGYTTNFTTVTNSVQATNGVTETNYDIFTQAVPTNGFPTNGFPVAYTVTNIVRTLGTNSFTNSVVLTLTTNDVTTNGALVTFTFTNTLGTFTNTASTNVVPIVAFANATNIITAVETGTNGPVFALQGVTAVVTNTTFVTNSTQVPKYQQTTTPDFTSSSYKSAKLLAKTPIVSGVAQPMIIVVRTGTAKAPFDYDVTGFFAGGQGQSLSSTKNGTTTKISFSEIKFSSPTGTILDVLGLENQTKGNIKSTKPAVTASDVRKSSKLVGAGDGTIPSAVSSIINGSVVISGT